MQIYLQCIQENVTSIQNTCIILKKKNTHKKRSLSLRTLICLAIYCIINNQGKGILTKHQINKQLFWQTLVS